MNDVNRTLYIPLYGKSYVSQKGILLQDPKAEALFAAEPIRLRGKAKSKWLCYFLAMRACVFDAWVEQQMVTYPNAVVLHLGCGLDSRVLRVKQTRSQWFDVDLPDVIAERKRHFAESDRYHMLAADLQETDWLQILPNSDAAIVVMEGVSMYLPPEKLQALFRALSAHFPQLFLLVDCYTPLAAKLSAYRNPIHAVGNPSVYGIAAPEQLAGNDLSFLQEHEITPPHLIAQLKASEQRLFRRLYAGGMSKKLYRMYEYRKG